MKKKYVKPEMRVIKVNIDCGPLLTSDIHDFEGNHRQLSGRHDLDDFDLDEDEEEE